MPDKDIKLEENMKIWYPIVGGLINRIPTGDHVQKIEDLNINGLEGESDESSYLAQQAKKEEVQILEQSEAIAASKTQSLQNIIDELGSNSELLAALKTTLGI